MKRLKKYWRQKPIIVVLAAGILVVVAIGVAAYSLRSTGDSAASVAIPKDNCAANNTATFTCYHKELDQIVAKQGPEPAMALVRSQYDKSAYVKSQCHQLVHVIGRAALAKYDYDLGQVYAHGDHLCASGYFHGASEQIIIDKGADYVINNAAEACRTFAEKDRYSLNHYNCVHGLGHGLMEATDHEVFQAIKICEAFSDSWELRSCDSGVFMQNIMVAQSPDESADHASKYLKKDNLMYPCDAVAEKHQWGCYIIQSSWALSQSGYDYGKVFGLCAKVTNEEPRQTCYQSLGRDASGLQGNDIEKTKSACLLGATPEAESNCFVGAAKDYVYHFHNDKKARSLCAALDANLNATCVQAVDSYYATFR